MSFIDPLSSGQVQRLRQQYIVKRLDDMAVAATMDEEESIPAAAKGLAKTGLWKTAKTQDEAAKAHRRRSITGSAFHHYSV